MKLSPFFTIKEDKTIMARLNLNEEFEITIPKPESRLEKILKEHEVGHP
jgi:hypothetical protein